MAKKDKNLPVDQKWNDTAPLGNMAFNHDFVDGEYVKKDYAHEEYPKMMYHADYLAHPTPGQELSFTQQAQRAENADEETKLCDDGFSDSLAKLGIVTAPDAADELKKRKAAAAAGSDWRKSVNGGRPPIGEAHLEFLKAAGAQVETLADVYTFLAQMSSQQMNAFLAEVEAAKKPAAAKAGKKQLVSASV